MSESDGGAGCFEEDEHWELVATDGVPNGPTQPYLQFNCPTCNTPNAFGYGVNKRDMPVDCVECGEPFRLRVAVCSTAPPTDDADGGDV